MVGGSGHRLAHNGTLDRRSDFGEQQHHCGRQGLTQNKPNGTAASQVNFWSPHNGAQKRSVSAMFSGVQAAAPDNSSRRDWVNESTSSTSLAEGLILTCTSRCRKTSPRSMACSASRRMTPRETRSRATCVIGFLEAFSPCFRAKSFTRTSRTDEAYA